ncbi:MAG: 50S ribosomal protein L24 [Candidatus Micrarchaeota archaeon]
MKISSRESIQPRKKRRALIYSKIHSMKRLLRVHLSKALRQQFKKRSLLVKKGDKVRILTGNFRKREGKVIEVDVSKGRLYIEGIIQKKQGGKEVFAPVIPSNCILLEWAQPRKKEKVRRQAKAAVPKMAKLATAPKEGS